MIAADFYSWRGCNHTAAGLLTEMAHQAVLDALREIKEEMMQLRKEQQLSRMEAASVRSACDMLRSDLTLVQQMMGTNNSRGSGSTRSSTPGMRLLCPLGCETVPGTAVTFSSAHNLQDHLVRAVGLCKRAHQSSKTGAINNHPSPIPYCRSTAV